MGADRDTGTSTVRAGRARDTEAEYGLLVKACRSFATGPNLALDVVPGWQEAAERAGLLSVVADVLVRAGRSSPSLRTARFSAADTHLRAGPDRRWLTSTLDGAGFSWVYLKGPVLSCLAYARPYLRSYGDLDVLVHPSELPEVVELLQQRGCRLLDTNWVAVAAGRRGQISMLLPRGQVLDLHWHLVNDPSARSAFRLSTDVLLAGRTQRDVGGERFPSLDPLDVVVHVAVHACLSGLNQLKWLLDVDQAVRWAASTPLDLRERAVRLGVALPVAVTLDRVVAVLGTSAGHARAFDGSPWRSGAVSPFRARMVTDAPGRRHPEYALYSSTRSTSRQSVLAAARHYARRFWGPPPIDLSTHPPAHSAQRAKAQWLADAATGL